MLRFINNKDVFKECLQSLAFIILSGALLNVTKAYLHESLSDFIAIIAIVTSALLTMLCTLFAIVHSAGGITKLYYNDFKVPFIERPCSDNTTNPGLMCWVSISCVFIYLAYITQNSVLL